MQVKSFLKGSAVIYLLLCFARVQAQFDTSAISAKLVQAKEKVDKNFAFILYKDNKILYKKEAGNFTIKTAEQIGATSQWLTTALVMTFVQEGKLSLDDKVSDYLPLFTKHFKSFITIRHCLTHFTGIRSEQGVAKLLQKNKFRTLEEEVDEFASKRDIQTNAGEEFNYSNVGFNIAGRVLEVISKKSFDKLVQDRIVRQLSMKATTFTNEDYNDAVNPSTGARSTAADFTNFLAMLLNKGKFNGKQVLTENSVKMMHTLTTETGKIKYAPKVVEGLAYGLGEWILETDLQGNASSVAIPSLNGTWAMIDMCRGYACVILTKNVTGEQTRNMYMDIKRTIDSALGGSCR